MPDTAIIDGKKVISWKLSDDKWESAKKSDITMDCCGSVGYARTSPLGFRHFYHEKNSECPYHTEGETANHRKLKKMIFQECEKLGWDADIEHRSGDWIADVFAENGDMKVVFEVQLSSQTYERTVYRTNLYKKDGIRCYWLFRQIPNIINGSQDIDIFEVTLDNDTTTCKIFGEIIQLSEFVKRALLGVICAPKILAKDTNKEKFVNDLVSESGVSSSNKATATNASFPDYWGSIRKKASSPAVFSRAPIHLSEEESRLAEGIMEFLPDKIVCIDEDHILYESNPWDIIGSCPSLDSARSLRHRAWSYYHCTRIIVRDGKYVVIAQDLKNYISQPGLHAIRNSS